MLEISIVPATGADDGEFVARVAGLINVVYADAEKGLWLDGTHRTSPDEVATVIRAEELAVARLDDQLVGAVRVQRLDDATGGFGMLAASPEHRGTGIGRELVAFTERWARDRGLVRMQLELLVPQTWTHPSKEFLRGWYIRIGYQPVRTDRLDGPYPHLRRLLATPCDLVVYHKPLS